MGISILIKSLTRQNDESIITAKTKPSKRHRYLHGRVIPISNTVAKRCRSPTKFFTELARIFQSSTSYKVRLKQRGNCTFAKDYFIYNCHGIDKLLRCLKLQSLQANFRPQSQSELFLHILCEESITDWCFPSNNTTYV